MTFMRRPYAPCRTNSAWQPRHAALPQPRKWLAALAAICLAPNLQAEMRTITLEDFGGKADGQTDCGPALQKALDFAKENPGTTLRLGGVVRILTPQAYDGDTDEAYKGGFAMAAAVRGATNLTIEDGEILLGGAFGALIFDRCEGLTLRNVTFDYDPPIHSQGKILSSDRAKRSILVEAEAGYPAPDGESFAQRGHTWFMVFKPDGEPGFHHTGHVDAVTTDGKGRVTLTHDRADLAEVLEGAEGWRYARMQRAHGHLIVMQFCDKVRVEGCSFYGTSAFAALLLFCNDVVLSGNRIGLRPESGRLVSTCADGFHFNGARRGPLIENNDFDRLVDDNIVISLRGNRVKSWGGNELQLEPYSCTWYEQGDTIEVVTLDDGQRRDYKIVAMAPQKNLFAPPRMTLDRPLEGKIVPLAEGSDKLLPTMVFNKSWRMDGTIIRNNRFQNTRRYAVFMGAGGVRIEDNVMSNFTSAAILCSHFDVLTGGPDVDRYPYYFTDNLLIRNNTISGALNFGMGGRTFVKEWHETGAIETYGGHGHGRRGIGVGDLRLARNFDITGNTIKNSGSTGIHIANTVGVNIAGNTILNPNLLSEHNRFGIWVEASSDVTVEDNKVEGANVEQAVKIEP